MKFLLTFLITVIFAIRQKKASASSDLGLFDKYGVIMVPTYGRRLQSSNTFRVRASGRISTSITQPENIAIINQTGFLRIPEYESKRMNFRLRKDHFHTYAIASVSVALEFEGVESFIPIEVRSGANGTFHVETEVTMPPNSTSEVIQVSLKDIQIKNDLFLAEEEGFSIICDVDDTLRVSEVLSKLRLLTNTFLFPFKDIEGMPMLLRDLQKGLTVNTSRGFVSKPTFHYLSGTPYQFLGSLQPFLERVYPLGEIISQTFSQDSGGFASFTDIKPYKILGATKIMQFFSKRKFIMIGDSTQFDPEVYARMALVNPESVVCIFIRIVSGVNIKAELVQNSNARFESAFTGIPLERWSLFNHPSDLPSAHQIAKGVCRKHL